MKVLDTFVEILAWLRIAASPALAGIILGLVAYYNLPGTQGLVLGIASAALGLLIGIVWATRVWKTQGTSTFMSRINASPDLDNLEENKDSK